MDKEYFKILIEKYLDGNASTAEVKELCEWIKNIYLILKNNIF